MKGAVSYAVDTQTLLVAVFSTSLTLQQLRMKCRLVTRKKFPSKAFFLEMRWNSAPEVCFVAPRLPQ
jgi:hypothetical protein